tara:strand:- start:390 stop:1265 length:876 start_codon:yes stop_codon:yes gene_type:complete
MGINWKKRVLDLRDKAAELQESHPDAALMRCRKAMEAIQHSIFEEKFEKVPEGYIPFEKIMGKKMIGDQVPKPQVIEFNTIQQWGNFGSHYQDVEPTSGHVDLALGALDNLIAWRFTAQDPLQELKDEFSEWALKTREPSPEAQKKFVNFYLKKVGSRSKLPEDFIFKYINTSSSSGPVQLITRAVELCAKKDDWALLSDVGNQIRVLDKSFKITKQDGERLIDLVKKYPDHFELKQASGEKQTHWFVRNIGKHAVLDDPDQVDPDTIRNLADSILKVGRDARADFQYENQ